MPDKAIYLLDRAGARADEVEKAHPKVFDIFLQLFDEGRITDAKGRTVDASNCIIVLTSNIRPGKKDKRLGFGAHDDIPQVDDIPELKQFFRPELLNRIDEQILFNALDRDDIQRILAPMLTALCRRLKDQHNISLEINDQVGALLIENGYKPEFGARELRRTVERLLEAKLAEKLLEHEMEASSVTWKVARTDDEIKIEACQS